MHDRTQLQCQNALRGAAQRYDLVLVPGRFNSGPEHWQSIWQQTLPIWQRVEQRHWNDPDTHRLNGSLRRLLAGCKRPALLVGHSLGALSSVCLAAELPQKVAGVMLVAPAEPARFHAEDDVHCASLGVPGLLVASHTDPFMSFARAEHWAALWRCELIDLGEAGHINVDSGFGSWHYGLELLCRLVARMDAGDPGMDHGA
ncbi:MAG: alpha/beta hydrolase [Rhodoferax sp.]|uniref:RBBP9/YdeN family alpha/beta hydrolase n=1 Tax=Rhodoferax sp. TaxID=50421 RepID=UPI001B4D1CB3|nr:alpha/beta hydrolase [Rhodoferax sp.]MBP9905149.1 alpha/beta hydrolase [Rhodoferax sp.]